MHVFHENPLNKNHSCIPDACHFDVINIMHVNLMCYWVSASSELLLPYSITKPLRIWCAPINIIELYQYVFFFSLNHMTECLDQSIIF